MDRPIFVPAVFYKDPLAALKWLERAFGFETTSLVTDADGKVAHSEMSFGGGVVSVGGEWGGGPIGPARMRSPASLDGMGTQFLRITLAEGLDEHCEAARTAGAQIVDEPTDQFYGARTYRALDPEGHVWNFTQDVRVVSAEEMSAATGLKFSATAEPAS
jgi:uncharacterized glyoxalase superfamily protein PhnB